MKKLSLADQIVLCTCRKSDPNPARCRARIAAVERLMHRLTT